MKHGSKIFRRPPLDLLLSTTPTSRLQVEAVEHLLDEGADPNEKFAHTSAWERYLSALERSPIASEEESHSYKIIISILEHGADPVFDRREEGYFSNLMSTQFDVHRTASLEQLRLRQKQRKQKQQRPDRSGIRLLLRLR